MAPPPAERRCTATAKRGGQCTGWRLKSGGDFCAFHDSETQRKNAKAAGEQKTARAAQLAVARAEIRLAALEEVPATIERIAHNVAAGLMGWREGGILARLAAAAVSAHATIDELADRAHKRRTGLTDEQLQAALERLRAQQREQREAMS
jgi:hypothetical protein